VTEKTGLFMLMRKRCDDLGRLTEGGGWGQRHHTACLGSVALNRGSFSEEIISNALQITKHLIIADSVLLGELHVKYLLTTFLCPQADVTIIHPAWRQLWESKVM
jgi:hypothetical protein